MREMKHTGFMHNYMRMYWGKKILEWTPIAGGGVPDGARRSTTGTSSTAATRTRFASVAWVFGLHDRPWQERPIFGTVRYMAASGLERKCDPQAYVEKVARLVERVSR